MGETGGEYPTTIGPDATFKGQLEFEKGARLLGSFEGEIRAKGDLVVAESGRLTGEATAANIRIEGQVKGNLHGSARVQLTASSRIEGDIQAARLEVAEGAVLVGRVTVGAKAGARPAGDGKPVSAAADKVAPKPAPTAAPVSARK